MKAGLKVKLILAFISVTILPVATGILVLTFLTSGFEEKRGTEADQLTMLLDDAKVEINDNISHLKDPLIFFEKINPLLSRYDLELVITEENGKVLFDSSVFSGKEHDSIWLRNLSSLIIQVSAEDGRTLNAELLANSTDMEPFKQFKEIIVAILTSIGTVFISLALLIVFMTWYFSRTILHPLKNIYTATEEMMEGNLDYPIPYRKKDEVGRFIQGFNLMRSHLKDSLEQQNQYEKARKELIASISHDLRTPLSSIKGYVEGLEDGIAKNEEMKKRYYSVIKNKTEQMDRLIEDLFEFSKFELNQLSIEKKLINCQEFFQNVFMMEQLEFAQSDAEFILEGSIPSGCLNIDERRMRQVLTNLFDNAIRYGGKRIIFSVRRKDESIEVSIKDDGQGISKDDLPLIFNHFFRGEKSRSRDHGGTGLGLAIVKYIIHAHDGEIYAKSEPNKGSEFIFILPCYMEKGE